MVYYYSGSTTVVVREAEYYPFGMLFSDNNLDKNKYLYGGKELNKEFFENYDFINRWYDAQLPRLGQIDPLAEKYYSISPYAYCMNNPVRFIDPLGMEVFDGNGDRISVYNDARGFDRVWEAIKKIYNRKSSLSDLIESLSAGPSSRDLNDQLRHAAWEELAESPLSDIPIVAINSGGGNEDGYGDTFMERLKNLPRAMWNDDVGKLPEGTISLSMVDNPISLVMPFSQFSKASLGFKTLGRASKTTMVTTTFFQEMGASGSLGGRWFTPLGQASNWETFLGRWAPFFMDSWLIYDYTKDNNNQ